MLLSDIKYLPGVGPKRAEILFKELGIATFEDLLYTFPFRYIDRTKFYTVHELTQELPYIQLHGKILRFQEISYGKRQKRYIAYFSDGTGVIELVFFQGLKWIQEKLKAGVEYIVFGKPTVYNGKINLVHPEVDEPQTDAQPLQSALQGVYNSTEILQRNGLGQRAFQRLQINLANAVQDKITETLPEYLLQQYHLMPLREALFNIHFPQSAERLQQAQYRLKLEELLYLQLGLLRVRNNRKETSRGFVFNAVGEHFNACYSRLPFTLTNAQKRVIKEIRRDMVTGKQMSQFLYFFKCYFCGN
jgi:ATP-dependent DNA helicase RecG